MPRVMGPSRDVTHWPETSNCQEMVTSDVRHTAMLGLHGFSKGGWSQHGGSLVGKSKMPLSEAKYKTTHFMAKNREIFHQIPKWYHDWIKLVRISHALPTKLSDT